MLEINCYTFYLKIPACGLYWGILSQATLSRFLAPSTAISSHRLRLQVVLYRQGIIRTAFDNGIDRQPPMY